MRLFFAIFCPPIAVLLCGKPFQGLILSPLLTLCYWIPGMIHALWVVNAYNREEYGRREHQLLMAAAKSTIAANVTRR